LFSSFFLSLLTVLLSSNPLGQLSSANHRREKAIRDAEQQNKKPSTQAAVDERVTKLLGGQVRVCTSQW
jgi:hypothetical protein